MKLVNQLTLLAVALTCLSTSALGQLNPNGLAFDASGNLWVANSGTNQILKLSPTTGAVLATISQGLNNPSRISFDSTNTLWVANFGGNTVTSYDAKSLVLLKTLSSNINGPYGVAVDAYGDVYVANNQANNIVVFNVDGRLIETLTKDNRYIHFYAVGALAINGRNLWVGIGSDFRPDRLISYNVGEFLTGDPAEILPISNGVSGPGGIAFDKSGNIYVTDFYNNNATKYSPTGKLLFTLNDLQRPQGIALDKSGNIYIGNPGANNILVFDSKGTLIRTLT